MSELRCCGAGVMPVCVSAEGEVFFVLGKERHVPGWRGSCRWSAFEGGTKDGEDVVATACREFVEESMGLLTDDTARMDLELRRREYSVRVAIRSPSGGGSEHVTYVKRFPLTPHLAEEFQATRSALLELQARANILALLDARAPVAHPFYRGDERLELPEGQARVLGVERVEGAGACVTIALRLERADGDAQSPLVLHWLGSTEEARAYRSWFAKRLEVQSAIAAARASLPSRAYDVSVDALGLVRSVRVCEDYLEKSEIRLWSFDELRVLIADRTRLESWLRPFFALVLERVIDEFTRDTPSERLPALAPPSGRTHGPAGAGAGRAGRW